MKIKILNRIIEIKFNRAEIYNPNKKKLTSAYRINKRILIYLLMVFSMFFISVIKTNRVEYKIGLKSPNDVIAYKDVVYKRNILDDELKEKIRHNTTPEYDEIENVAKDNIDKFDSFLQSLNSLELTNEEEINNLINEYSLNLSKNEIISVGISKSVKYYVHLSNILKDIYEIGIVHKNSFTKALVEKKIILTDIEKKLLANFIEPNLKLNREKTEEKIKENIEFFKNSTINIKKGDLILKKGEVVTHLDYDNLYNLGYINNKDNFNRITGSIIIFLLSSILFFIISNTLFSKKFNSKVFYPTIITLLLVDLLSIFVFNNSSTTYLTPLMILPIVISILSKDLGFTILVLSFNYTFVLNDIRWVLIVISLSFFAIYINRNISSRNEIIKNSILVGLIQAIFTFAFGIYNNNLFIIIIQNSIFSLLSGLITGIFTIGLLTFYENTFNILTDIKLIELSNFSNELLKNLLLIAPGTFHHSLMVGALSEAGAEAIGVNSILCRVASYYHDIGKMKRPSYFIENQQGIINPHNNLKSSLSALIIISHTKDGYFLGKNYNLPEEILDIILEHHGTTLVQYFYYKALNNNENVTEDDFRYPGPKPSTKESAIVMMADTVEAAVRASSNKSMDELEKLVRLLIKSKLDEGQFSDSEITFKEIELVILAFLKILKGIYHERIDYLKGTK